MRLALTLAIASGTLVGTPTLAADSGVAVGAYVKNANDPNGIESLEQDMCVNYQVCRVLALDLHYENWAFSKVQVESDDITAGRTPVIAWTENSPDMPRATDVVNGVYDQLLQDEAGYLYNLPNHATVIVEFVPEMTAPNHNGLKTLYGSSRWFKTAAGIQRAGALYQRTSKHIVTIMHKYAPNVKFVFAPETSAYDTTVGGSLEWTYFYPGSSIVDFVGADHKTGKADLSQDKYFKDFYTQASSTNLPVMLTQVCPDKYAAAYIESAITELPALFPAVVSFVYNDGKNQSCSLEGQDAVGDFASMAANSYFQLTF